MARKRGVAETLSLRNLEEQVMNEILEMLVNRLIKNDEEQMKLLDKMADALIASRRLDQIVSHGGGERVRGVVPSKEPKE